jgi:hypothetical protein
MDSLKKESISRLKTWNPIISLYLDLLKSKDTNKYVLNSFADWVDSEFLKDERNVPIIRD